MEAFLEPLLNRLPLNSLYIMGLIILGAMLFYVYKAYKDGREVKLLWGLFTLRPPQHSMQDHALKEAKNSSEEAHKELKRLREDLLSNIRHLQDEESKLMQKLVNDPHILFDQKQRLEQSINRLQQDRQRIEGDLMNRLDSLEFRLEDVGKSLKQETDALLRPTDHTT